MSALVPLRLAGGVVPGAGAEGRWSGSAIAALDSITEDGILVRHLPGPLVLDDELGPWLERLPPGHAGWERSGDASGYGTEEGRAAIVGDLPPRARSIVGEDVRVLAPLVARWTARKHVRVRLDPVRTDACRKLHHDYVAMRVLVTYFGPGTEWLEEEGADRSFLGRHDLDVATSNAHIVRDPARLHRAGTGDVLVLKGAAFPRTGDKGAIHRSPPIESGPSRAARLVLRVDVASCSC
jgi:hypothetical protein